MQKREKKRLIEWCGWYGAAAILLSYLLLSLGQLNGTDLSYHLLIASGSLAIAWEASTKKDYQPLLINIIFFIIATFSILHILLAYWK